MITYTPLFDPPIIILFSHQTYGALCTQVPEISDGIWNGGWTADFFKMDSIFFYHFHKSTPVLYSAPPIPAGMEPDSVGMGLENHLYMQMYVYNNLYTLYTVTWRISTLSYNFYVLKFKYIQVIHNLLFLMLSEGVGGKVYVKIQIYISST